MTPDFSQLESQSVSSVSRQPVDEILAAAREGSELTFDQAMNLATTSGPALESLITTADTGSSAGSMTTAVLYNSARL